MLPLPAESHVKAAQNDMTAKTVLILLHHNILEFIRGIPF